MDWKASEELLKELETIVGEEPRELGYLPLAMEFGAVVDRVGKEDGGAGARDDGCADG